MSAKDKKLLASRLRERIVIQFPVLMSDGLGGATESWNSLATVFAEVEVLSSSARERVIGAQREGQTAYRIVLRKRDDLSTNMRLQWRGQNLFIHGIASAISITEILAYAGGEV